MSDYFYSLEMLLTRHGFGRFSTLEVMWDNIADENNA